MLLNVACALIAMASPSLPAFYAALFCLGVGWNFMFVGGTTLLAQSYRPSERARAPGRGPRCCAMPPPRWRRWPPGRRWTRSAGRS
nr:hypothetical protein [Achromobacter xylosoxidans]